MQEFAPSAATIATLERASDEQLTAALEVMYLVAKADGFVAADELRHFLKVARSVSNQALDTTRLSNLIAEWKAREVDPEQRLGQIARVLDTTELRRAAYDLASRTATADGKLERGEESILALVEQALDIG